MLRRSARSSKTSAPPPKSTVQDTDEELESEEDPYACDSDDDFVPSPKKDKKSKSNAKYSSNSSSESDIDDYLQPADKIDLNSSFFRSEEPAFENIEKQIFSGITVTRLSDSDSSSDDEVGTCKIPSKVYTKQTATKRRENKEDIKKSLREGENAAKLNFQKLQDYTRKMEEAKRTVEQYKAKQATSGNEEIKFGEKININDLLAIGETRKDENKLLNSSSYESTSDSEQEDWEEIKSQQENSARSLLPKKELQITLEMPGPMRKKKGDDLLAAVKRRLNRIRKENQLLIHKVHLLCWIAHGNYVNKILNDQTMMALGLSMIPSEKSYPSGRIDLSYLEQILKWYKKTINLNEKVPSKSKSLTQLLIEQIDKKEAYTKKMLVLIFIIILRALGVQCRLVFSVQVESLRPSNNDLHSLAKDADPKLKNKGETNKIHVKEENDIEQGKSEKKIHAKKGENSKKIETKKTDVSKKIETKKTNVSDKIEIKIDVSEKIGAEKDEGSKKIETQRDASKSRKSLKIEKIEAISKPRKSSRVVTKTTAEATNEKSLKKDQETTGSVIERKSNSSEASKKSDEVPEKKSGSSKIPKNDKSTIEVETKAPSTRNRKPSEKGDKEKTKTTGKEEKPKPTETKDSKEKSQTRSTRSKTVDDKKSQDSTSTRSARSKSKLSVDSENSRSKSACSMTLKLEKINENHNKIRSKSTSSKTENEKIMQVDGVDDGVAEFKGFERGEKLSDMKSFEKFYSQVYEQISEGIKTRSLKKIPQLDGTSDDPSPSKPNLKKLKEAKDTYSSRCKSKKHKTKKTDSDSDGYFEGSPSKKIKESNLKKSNDSPSKSSSDDKGKKINLSKLKNKTTKNEAKTLDVKKDIMQLIKGRISEQKQVDKNRMVRKRKPVKNATESEDSDYAPEAIKKKHHSDSEDEFYPKMKVKQRVQVKKEVKIVKKLKKPKDANSRKVISSDSEYTEEEVVKKPQEVKKKRGNDTWLEVFLETEEKWISVDVVFGQVHCVNELFSRASHPVSYVLAWDNNNYVKDITRRYCQNFNTVTRKLRTDPQWWEASLKPFLGPKNARDKEEDEELDRQQLEKPLPTTISEYKNHPLYALERHLLKFEALYPPNAPPLGYVRNEPVYSRDCVHLCHSREIWLKDAKVVRKGEKPYKIVKARPKYDKLSNTMITDQMLEIFGPWQVEEYDPPTAENGIVPRNAYGNVDLFKPSMLPKKCAHLRLAGLNKVAKKMNIDCATAIVGFDFHGGFSHPVVDGFVVCEEYEDQLVAAWNIEQEEMERKEQEKYEARVYGNWKKLIKGLIIKEKLKAKYGFGEEKTEEDSSKTVGGKRKSKGPTFCTKKRRVISDSESEDDNK